MRKFFSAALFAAIIAFPVLADVSFEQTTRFTGGTMLEMMQKMGGMSGGRMGKALQDHTATVYLKGNKMAQVENQQSNIIDLDAGTITAVNHEKKSYTVMTFEEVKQMMAEAQQKMKGMSGNAGDATFDINVNPTGQTRTIEGKTAKEYLVTMTAKGGTGTGMKIKVDSWNVDSLAGSDEVREFYKKFTEKADFMPGMGVNPMMGGASKGLAGMAAAMRESHKLQGSPLLTETEVSGVNSPFGAMMGQNADPNAPFMKITAEYRNYSTSPVDDAKFSAPAEYKKEEMRRPKK